MKKIFLMILALVGVFTILAGPIEFTQAYAGSIDFTHVQPNETTLNPLCEITPVPLFRILGNGTTLLASSSGHGVHTPGGNNHIPGGTTVTQAVGGLVNGRRHIRWGSRTGWVLNSAITQVSC